MFDYTINSKQIGIHNNLERLLHKHRDHAFRAPISATQQQAFQQFLALIDDRPLLLDAGCGTGLSTVQLSEQYPQHCVIGVDKSLHRLQRASGDAKLLQADLIALWQQCASENMHIDKLFLLYPNPWPKAKHIQRRFHGHAIFPTLLSLCNSIECRSNWKLYLEEMAFAIEVLTGESATVKAITPEKALTRFEDKYCQSNTPVYQLLFNNN